MSGQKDRYIELSGAAEIAKFTPEERDAYQKSLKYYWDMQNVVDTSRDEGKEEGRKEGRKERNVEIAKSLKKNGISIDIIIQSTGLSKKEIDNL